MSQTTLESAPTHESATLKLHPQVAEKEPITFPPFKYSTLLSPATSGSYGDFRDALAKDGFVVVRGSVPRDRALSYRDSLFEWMENMGLGFKRDDPSTWVHSKLPHHAKGGMFFNYGIGHEQFLWDLRTEEGILDAFAKVWGTEELTTSFDGASVFLPNRTDVTDSGKWEHIDQSQYRRGFYCLQGLVNLNDCGPEDGGLMVLKGSSALMDEYFDWVGRMNRNAVTWGPVDWTGFSLEEQQWFFDRGCEWVKVEGEPGDLFLWNSQTMHYNVRPSGNRDRVCSYICMAPADLLTPEDIAIKTKAFRECRGTTHVPISDIFYEPYTGPVKRHDGTLCTRDSGIPTQPRKATDQVLKLAGILPYTK